MSDQEEIIAKFKDITGTSDDSDDRARFFLESSNWELQIAISSFYESQPEPETANMSENDRARREFVENESDGDIEDFDIPSLDSGTSLPVGSSSTSSNLSSSSFAAHIANLSKNIKSGATQKVPNKPKVTTLHNMHQRPPSDEEQGQAFYAGGSERSGQQILGPPKRKNEKLLAELIRMGHEHASIEQSSNDVIPSTSRSADIYQGPGLRLGQTEDDHSVVGNSETSNRSARVEPLVLKLWNQGFSINDGELRPYDDPNNKEFLETVMRGQIPSELRQMGNNFHIHLEDHHHEDFKKSSNASIKVFKGAGHALGSPTTVNVEQTISPAAQLPPSTIASSGGGGGGGNNDENEKKASEQLGLQTEQPTTMLQIRLADGTRLSGRFNLSHTIDDIRQYLITSRPQYENRNFILVTAFPTKELTDGSQTIQGAGISNASIMQRLK